MKHKETPTEKNKQLQYKTQIPPDACSEKTEHISSRTRTLLQNPNEEISISPKEEQKKFEELFAVNQEKEQKQIQEFWIQNYNKINELTWLIHPIEDIEKGDYSEEDFKIVTTQYQKNKIQQYFTAAAYPFMGYIPGDRETIPIECQRKLIETIIEDPGDNVILIRGMQRSGKTTILDNIIKKCKTKYILIDAHNKYKTSNFEYFDIQDICNFLEKESRSNMYNNEKIDINSLKTYTETPFEDLKKSLHPNEKIVILIDEAGGLHKRVLAHFSKLSQDPQFKIILVLHFFHPRERAYKQLLPNSQSFFIPTLSHEEIESFIVPTLAKKNIYLSNKAIDEIWNFSGGKIYETKNFLIELLTKTHKFQYRLKDILDIESEILKNNSEDGNSAYNSRIRDKNHAFIYFHHQHKKLLYALLQTNSIATHTVNAQILTDLQNVNFIRVFMDEKSGEEHCKIRGTYLKEILKQFPPSLFLPYIEDLI